MAKYVSKIVGEEITANGTKRNVTKLFLCDEKGNILHDKAREDDAEGVNRRIEVEAHKHAIREGAVLRTKDEKGKWAYNGLFHEEFSGSIDQAEAEIKDELKMRAEIEAEFAKKTQSLRDMKKQLEKEQKVK